MDNNNEDIAPIPCCHECGKGLHSHKHRSETEQKTLLNRLRRIEGQIRGIEKMVENEAYCPDILTQVAAVNCALNSFNKELLAEHIRTCVAEDIRIGNDETIDELVRLTQKLMR
ncbi:MAG: metal-sensing transcriptional repressor [Clostridiales bacterium]|nr:metal-sensing transcriptional repressor [Clostridiales bacterium]